MRALLDALVGFSEVRVGRFDAAARQSLHSPFDIIGHPAKHEIAVLDDHIGCPAIPVSGLADAPRVDDGASAGMMAERKMTVAHHQDLRADLPHLS